MNLVVCVCPNFSLAMVLQNGPWHGLVSWSSNSPGMPSFKIKVTCKIWSITPGSHKRGHLMLQGICLCVSRVCSASGSARFRLLMFRSEGQTQGLTVHLLFLVFHPTWPVPGPDSVHRVLALIYRTDICPLSSSQPRQLGPAENLAPRRWFIQTCKLLLLFLCREALRRCTSKLQHSACAEPPRGWSTSLPNSSCLFFALVFAFVLSSVTALHQCRK